MRSGRSRATASTCSDVGASRFFAPIDTSPDPKGRDLLLARMLIKASLQPSVTVPNGQGYSGVTLRPAPRL